MQMWAQLGFISASKMIPLNCVVYFLIFPIFSANSVGELFHSDSCNKNTINAILGCLNTGTTV